MNGLAAIVFSVLSGKFNVVSLPDNIDAMVKSTTSLLSLGSRMLEDKQRQLGSELAKKVKDLPGGELLASIIREADFITLLTIARLAREFQAHDWNPVLVLIS